jgi:uncharacterized membrane protein YkoI
LAKPLDQVRPTALRSVPGQVIDISFSQIATGTWAYGFLVLTREGAYREVVVDARRNQVIEIRRR